MKKTIIVISLLLSAFMLHAQNITILSKPLNIKFKNGYESNCEFTIYDSFKTVIRIDTCNQIIIQDTGFYMRKSPSILRYYVRLTSLLYEKIRLSENVMKFFNNGIATDKKKYYEAVDEYNTFFNQYDSIYLSIRQ